MLALTMAWSVSSTARFKGSYRERTSANYGSKLGSVLENIPPPSTCIHWTKKVGRNEEFSSKKKVSKMNNWLLEVTDLKQYVCCPRIVFYRYCLPKIRPTTVLMEEGILKHSEEDEREERRSLRNYGVTEGERFFHLALQSEQLGLSGRIDLVIASPARNAANAEISVVEYKYSEQKAGAHFKLQLAAYALLVEDAWQVSVKQGYIYSIPTKNVETIPITAQLRKKVVQTVTHIRQLVAQEIMPEPPAAQGRCVTCEFRRFCNDVV